ncbi:zygote arrest protein 1 isoform X1 [Rhincodon typus]|uniref:zygote arrest protein 1 isoform X1 n=1 Tax=Rhincodon typus TaxID=259920 RepID=UPI002030F29C|nr:zygote arrest protein 1 isoform X1 [Rhincodon typus]
MATLGEDAFDYIYSPYNPYSYQYLSSRPKASSWRPRSYLNYGDPGEYFDNYQRAQLKAILSQVNPNLTPRVRKANTKDVGVQVNPKIDASVQCSLGPRTLMMMTTRQRRRPPPNQVQGSPASMPRNVRFRRTMAIYSPIVSPNLNSFVYRGEPREAGRQGPKEAPAKPQQEEKDEPEGVKQEDGVQEEPAPEQEQEPAPEQGPTPEEKGDEPTDCLALPAGELPEAPVENENEPEAGNAVTKTSKNEKRLRFQFLEQKYGYFHCKECNARWESAYVWCVQGTNKVYFKQFCRTCEKAYNPYRVEDITCQTCKQTRCTCPVKMRHVDPKRPHRQDLCGRCKGKRLSCDSTFSFKYII